MKQQSTTRGPIPGAWWHVYDGAVTRLHLTGGHGPGQHLVLSLQVLNGEALLPPRRRPRGGDVARVEQAVPCQFTLADLDQLILVKVSLQRVLVLLRMEVT